ncbi:uncharacterized protein LOC112519177 [Cynara cardunculus var. scolymus]|uniref:uncharacterized protein LOC112519177 n=1 Tax=Cynara cardunculus var. scolymus TaxID=59895 RepID=UPI000D625F06|nr:uncharacterized protein LOC112519177 [Cynara cardunculus var. scolymus]
MRVLAYETSGDVVDEYLRMSRSTTREALMYFVDGVISCFDNEYLRKPNEAELARLLYTLEINVDSRVRLMILMTYYLTDGIYPSWIALVKSVTSPQMRKHKLFAQVQEACRKDVERAFGVLQARFFAFIRRPCLVWDIMGRIMINCIIMHNMIVEDKRDTYQNYYDPTEFLNDMLTNRQQKALQKMVVNQLNSLLSGFQTYLVIWLTENNFAIGKLITL